MLNINASLENCADGIGESKAVFVVINSCVQIKRYGVVLDKSKCVCVDFIYKQLVGREVPVCTHRLLELVGDVVHGHPGAGPRQRLAQLLGPSQRLVDGARARRPLSHVLSKQNQYDVTSIMGDERDPYVH